MTTKEKNMLVAKYWYLRYQTERDQYLKTMEKYEEEFDRLVGVLKEAKIDPRADMPSFEESVTWE